MNLKVVLSVLGLCFVAVCPVAFSEEPSSSIDAEAAAKISYDEAEKAAQAAESEAAKLRAVMQKADSAYAAAKKVADAQRQNATVTKSLAGEQGVKELQLAEAAVPIAISNLAQATDAVPPLQQALAEAKAEAEPLQQAFDTAEKAAKEAEAAAKLAADAANRIDDEAKRAEAQATAKQRLVDSAKMALQRAQQNQQTMRNQASTVVAPLAEAKTQKKAAEEVLAKASEQLAAATTAYEAILKTAEDAEVNAAKAAVAEAQAAVEKSQAQVNALEQQLARFGSQHKLAEAGLLSVQKQLESATAALAAAEKTASEFARDAEAKKAIAADAAAKRKAAAADPANQEAQAAAQDLLQLDAASKSAAADAAAKRKLANDAKAALDPKAKTLEQALIKANAATQTLDRAQQRKIAVEKALVDLKERIAAAKQSHQADEEVAQQAEAAAVPLKDEAEKTRAAYLASRATADQRRIASQQAKDILYRLIAARQVADVMESSEPPKPTNRIDEIVFTKLRTLNIEPVLCSDAVFVRRLYLDLTGKLPTADQAKAFILDASASKRADLVDQLLEQTSHFDFWAMKWSDVLRVKAEFPVKVWPNAAQAYHRWIWESVAQNKPYDQFAGELLTSSGSNYRVGPVNFYRAIQDITPEGIAASVSLALMGSRLHSWPEDRRAGMAAFFSQVGYKPTSEWKEEIVFWDPLNSTAILGCNAAGIDDVSQSVAVTNQISTNLAEPLSPNGPLSAIFPDGTPTTIPADRDPREAFAEWLIQPDNPWFAKAIVNRTWAWAMGRGIIHEPDDIRDDNPPSNPELLAYLQQQFVENGYNLKHLKRLIFSSTTYQFSSISRFEDEQAKANFASYEMRRVEAEVLIDAINEITGSKDLYTSAVPEPFTYIPDSMSAVALADGSITSSFLTLFGRSARATGMENERVSELESSQWLHMLNSVTIQNKLQTGPKLAALISAGGPPNEMVERLYLTILSRFPTNADIQAAEEHAKSGATKGRDVWVDLAWALINSPEFLMRH